MSEQNNLTINIDPSMEVIEVSGLQQPLERWQIEIAKIAMLPRAKRPATPVTMGRFGITEKQYYYWLRHPLILKAKRLLTKRFYQDDIPDIIEAMRNEALNGNTKAAELFLEYVDEWKAEEEDNRAIRRNVMSKAAVQEMLTKFRSKKV